MILLIGFTFFFFVHDSEFTPNKDQIIGIFKILRKHDVISAITENDIKRQPAGHTKSGNDVADNSLQVKYPIKKQFFQAWFGKDYRSLRAYLEEYNLGTDPAEIKVEMDARDAHRGDWVDEELHIRFAIMKMYLGTADLWEDDNFEGSGVEEEDDKDSCLGEMEQSGDKMERLSNEFKNIHASLIADLQVYLNRSIEVSCFPH